MAASRGNGGGGGSSGGVPNGGYGWVVVACSFVVHMLAPATMFSLSVLYVSWLEEFGATKSQTSWVVSVGVAFLYGMGPVAAFMCGKVGDRVVCVSGSLIAFLGFALSSLANSVSMLIVCTGLLGGLGMGLCYLPAVAVVALYFDTKRALAYGFAIAGVGIGVLVQAPIINFLEQIYGWRGTLLILSAIQLHNAVCGLLMRPPERRPAPEVTVEDVDALVVTNGNVATPGDEAHDRLLRNVNSTQNCNSFQDITGQDLTDLHQSNLDSRNRTDSFHGPKHDRSIQNGLNPPVSIEIRNGHKIVNNFLILDKSANGSMKTSSVQHLSSPSPDTRQFSSAADLRPTSFLAARHLHNYLNGSGVVPWSNVDIMLSGSIHGLHVVDNESHNGSILYLHSKHCKLVDGSQREESEHVCDGGLKSNKSSWFRDHFKSLVEFLGILKDKVFLVLAICNFLTNLSFLMPVLYMVDRALEDGIDKSTGAIFVAMNGAGSVFGRLFFAFLASRSCFGVLELFIFVLGFAGLVTCLSPASGSVAALHAMYSFIFGALMGGWSSLLPSLVVEFMGVERIGQAFGIICLFSGVASCLGPPVAGWVYAWTGDFTVAFILHGLALALSGAVLIPFLVQKLRGKKLRDSKHDASDPS